MMPCERAQDLLSEYLEEALLDDEAKSVDAHLAGCAACRQRLEQLRGVVALLRAVPREPLPEDLQARIHDALAALPDTSFNTPVPWWKRFNLASAATGAAVAAAALVIWQMQSSSLPRIETAAVQENTNVAVNIGFDVASNVDDVIFQVDLPDGLKFVDGNSQPMQAQSVSWKGSLKKGNTVIPIVVRGVRPGRWDITAYVRKGAMMRKTTIEVPVSAS
ncbi:MAG TPA: anti-sigma factor [Oscillatoriaceae cyanobacterium]